MLSTLLLLLLAGVATSDPAPDDPPPSRSPSTVRAAAFADGRLWLLAGDGGLTSIAENGFGRIVEPVGGKPIALCVEAERLMLLSTSADGRWTLRRREAGDWRALAHIATRGDSFVGMTCDATGISLLTNRRLIEIGKAAPRSIALSNRLNPGVTHALLIMGDRLLVGTNAGEWGGGLQKVDRRTGQVSQLERNDNGEPCDAIIDRQCTPVNALTPAPWNPGCAIAAVGMVHMFPSGRLAEICGDQIDPLYAKVMPGPDDWPADRAYGHVAFFGANQAADTLWAVGIDGLYRFRDRKPVDFRPLPTFHTIGGVRVSFDMPGVVLVLTDINQSVSLSGSVPMLVSR